MNNPALEHGINNPALKRSILNRPLHQPASGAASETYGYVAAPGKNAGPRKLANSPKAIRLNTGATLGRPRIENLYI